MSKPPSFLRTTLPGAVAALALVFSLSPSQSVAASAAPERSKTDRAVQADLAADDRAKFWVFLKGQADLSAVAGSTGKIAKTTAVYRAKKQHAESAQAGLRRLLTAAKADFTPFWIANAVLVTGDRKLAAGIERLPEVASISPDVEVAPPTPLPGAKTPKVNAVEWNVDRVNAPRVWNELKNRGEGVVVANIDTGVQFDHPALATQYRGRNPDGTVDHNYNWFDPSLGCAIGTPCDWNGHGTHTMGTMVGDDGAGDTIGVAPGARWIAAKMCDTVCSSADMLKVGEWLLAPTDLNGANPRPDLAPDIVNNSWGYSGYYPWFRVVVDTWIAAGIFPSFSNGNVEIARCNTSASPGLYVGSYSAGAFDAAGTIASFSARGTGEAGDIKPNLAAPGVNVRSSVTGGGYASYSGTSMAAPHVSATVALMWSAAPALRGDVAATRALLDRTAVDVDDTTCGGTAADNNVWGEGRLDAYAAVRAVPYQQLGGVTGTVTSGTTPVAGAGVTVTGPLTRTVHTTREGTFTLPRLPAGDYRLTVDKFGYGTAAATVTVAADQTPARDISLDALPSGVVSGTVTGSGGPAAGATVAVPGTPVRSVTDASGRYRVTLPHGTYDLKVTPEQRCADDATASVTVGGDVTKDVHLGQRTDAFGYTCTVGTEPYVAGTERLGLCCAWPSRGTQLPFPFPLYGKTYRDIAIYSHGFMCFECSPFYPYDYRLPSPTRPNAAIYPFWDWLEVDANSGVYTATVGTAPNRTFIVEWRDVYFYTANHRRISFSALLGENGSISYRYRGLQGDLESGATATVGIENHDGTQGIEYSFNAPSLRDGQTLTFTPGRHGVVQGLITDANDGKPLAGATVKFADGQTRTTLADGSFHAQVPIGDQRVEVSKEHYGTVTKDISVASGAVADAGTTLVTGSVAAGTGEVTLVVPAGAQRTGNLTLTNLGRASTAYTVESDPGQTWLTVTPATGDLAPNAAATLKVNASANGQQAGTVRTGKLRVRSASGRRPEFEVTVKVVAPKHQVAVDAGGTRDVVDAAGDRWTADRRYTAGAHGYVGNGNTRVHTATRPIAGTGEQELFKRARERVLEYRFDNVPDGVYTVELAFAETRGKQPGQRVFDVYAEGKLAVPGLDLAHEVGVHTATTRQYTVWVADGQLNVQFAALTGDTIVNAIRISERPDKVIP
ncbi:S8 family serine peptidase [Sinosporangium siamense]|uniref:alpha-amylase n=1 Tax=Sinosporangium siamense TaxID=1367973 RepID=A0A919RE17_9ACTN|nr:S8 family serine peptidase [Sinosporangium siamense]GII91898.1 hypothetical protein Ssi02_21290 [Sinosporangium siamense]